MEQWQKNAIATKADKCYARINDSKRKLTELFTKKELSQDEETEKDVAFDRLIRERGKLDGICDVLGVFHCLLVYDEKSDTHDVIDMI